ncbi:MAG: hypothetical protein Q8922_07970 [Bacteroidota bacterium]|nr:hypothetical protein [Bacteroidota bacterium]MDP4234160.1 hypothetical protein [Bacteroidota bacterium]MDP4244018.1 hypothetical protein [Bacteroidota bacterium]MDP4287860.1 hypothetical protein [Bacteroidota bacterium]
METYQKTTASDAAEQVLLDDEPYAKRNAFSTYRSRAFETRYGMEVPRPGEREDRPLLPGAIECADPSINDAELNW